MARACRVGCWRTGVLLLSLLLLLGACRHADPAPEELDALLHFFLAEYDQGDSALLDQGGQNVVAWFQDEAGAGESEGTVSDLLPSELELLGMADDTDTTWLNGVYHLSLQTCTLDEIERIYLEPDQSSLFPDAYTSYLRTFTDGLEDYPSHQCNSIRWTSLIEDSLLGKTMVYELNSGLQWQLHQRQDRSQAQLLLSRTVMPSPATIGQGDGSAFFDQSYQIEVFVELDGQALHLYGLWNSGGLDGIDPEAPIWSNEYIDGLKTWDTRIDEICQQGLVPQ